MLSDDELARYERQIIIPGFGPEGQEKLKNSRVVVIGSGGLGSAAAVYLAAAGVGMIRLVDDDRVELSNLNRQVLHWDKDIGKSKVTSAAEKLKGLNPQLRIETIDQRLSDANVTSIITGTDALVDATDNLETRLRLNRAALEQSIPLFHGAVFGFQGRAMTVIPGQSACLRCLYHGVMPQEKLPVIGVTPAIIGCIQATEVIKYLTGKGRLLVNRLLLYDGLEMRFREMKVNRDPTCEHCGQANRETQ